MKDAAKLVPKDLISSSFSKAHKPGQKKEEPPEEVEDDEPPEMGSSSDEEEETAGKKDSGTSIQESSDEEEDEDWIDSIQKAVRIHGEKKLGAIRMSVSMSPRPLLDDPSEAKGWKTKRSRRDRQQRPIRQKVLSVEQLHEKLANKEKELDRKISEEIKKNKVGRNKMPRSEQINYLNGQDPEGFNNMFDDIWELVVMYVDSGATETVLTEGMLSMLELKEGIKSKRGVTYEVANGMEIANLVEKNNSSATQKKE